MKYPESTLGKKNRANPPNTRNTQTAVYYCFAADTTTVTDHPSVTYSFIINDQNDIIMQIFHLFSCEILFVLCLI